MIEVAQELKKWLAGIRTDQRGPLVTIEFDNPDDYARAIIAIARTINELRNWQDPLLTDVSNFNFHGVRFQIVRKPAAADSVQVTA